MGGGDGGKQGRRSAFGGVEGVGTRQPRPPTGDAVISRKPPILPTRSVGQGSDKVEKVYVFGGSVVKKSEYFRLYHFATGDKVYKTRAFLLLA
jgi:hypothetical protein